MTRNRRCRSRNRSREFPRAILSIPQLTSLRVVTSSSHCEDFCATVAMIMVVQIYSLTSIADAVATAEAGADLVGVVVAEAGVVPEGVDARLARDILAGARPRARGVAMSLLDDRDEICAMVDAVRPDILHIAARELDPDDCAWIRERIAPVRLLRAIAVRTGETMTEVDAHQHCADFLMLEAGAKGAAGEVHEYSICRDVVTRSRVPVILAGGLSPENVAN